MSNKNLITVAVFALLFLVVGTVGAYSGSLTIQNVENLILGGESGQDLSLGGDSNFDSIDVADGYKVDGTTIIDGSGNFDGAITGTTATLSSTLNVTGVTSLAAANVDNLTYGAGILASSTSAAAGTLTEAQLIAYSSLDFTPGDAAVTLTLPATSTMTSFIATAGECRDFRIRNLDATAATSTTIAAGTGIDLVENENGDVVIEGGNEAQLKFCRESDTDVTVYVDEYIAAD